MQRMEKSVPEKPIFHMSVAANRFLYDWLAKGSRRMMWRRRIFSLALIMIAISTLIGIVAMKILYETAFEQQRNRLVEIVRSQARLMESVARFDAEYSTDFPDGARAATIHQIREAHDAFQGFKTSGEFTLAKREKDRIVFLLRHSLDDDEGPDQVAWNADLAEPMRRALQGLSGTLVGWDYRGQLVLAAHEPVRILNLGIVAEIDLKDVRAPFIQAAKTVLLVGILIVALGSWIFHRISTPLISAIQKSESRFRSLVETAPSVILGLSPDYRILEFNPEAEKLYGCGRESVLGTNYLTRFIPEEDREEVAADIDAVLAGRVTSGFENAIVTAGGERRILTWCVNRNQTPDGEVLGLTAVGQDITDRIRLEETLKRFNEELEARVWQRSRDLERAKKRLHTAQQVARMGFLDWNLVNDEVYWSEELYHLFDIVPGEYAPSVETTLALVHPEDLVRVKTDLRAALRGEKSYDVDHRMRTPNGRIVHVNAQAELFRDEDGKPIRLLGTVVDITRRKRAEERLRESESLLRTLLNAPRDAAFFLMEPGGRILITNDALAVQLGGPHGETSLVDQNIFDLWPAPLADSRRQRLLELVENGLHQDRFEDEFGGRLYGTNFIAVHNRQGVMTHIAVFSTDITQKVQNDIETLRTAQLASVGELAASVAHEINNPINGIMNYARLLEKMTAKTDGITDLPARIIKESHRIARITSSLLTYSRPFGKKTPVSMARVVAEVLTLVGTQLNKEGIRLRNGVTDDLPEIVGNFQQLTQVFLNLISNARFALNQKYPDNHENKVIELSGRVVSVGDRPLLRIHCVDHGIGIPPARFDRVKDPFFTTKPVGEGTGLGLHISTRILHDHHGDLTIHSSEGEFTRITMDLPL